MSGLVSAIVVVLAAGGDPLAGEARVAGRLEIFLAPDVTGCIGEAALAQAVEERLGRPVFHKAGPADVTVKGEIRRSESGAGHAATLTLIAADGVVLGVRQLEDSTASCAALDRPLAIVVALMVNLRPDEIAAHLPAAAAMAAAAVPPRPTPPSTPPAASPWMIELGAAAAVIRGALPGFAPGVRVHGSLARPRMPSFELSAVAFPTATATVGDADARLTVLRLGAAICSPRPDVGSPELRLCAGLEAGGLRGAAGGLPDNRVVWGATLDPLVGAAVGWPLQGRLNVYGGLAAGVPILRRTVEFQTPTAPVTLFRAEPFWVRGELGLARSF